MTNDELPLGWAITPLGNVASFEMGQAPPGSASNFEGKGTAFVKAGEFGPKRPVIREWTTEPKKFAAEADVLICVVGATAGKLNLGANCAIGRSVASIRPSEAITQLALYYQLLLQVESLRASSTGSAQGVISKEMLGAIEVAIPPLAEQKRIADKVEAVLGRVDACRARLDRVPDLLKRFRQSVLAAATSGQLTEDWREENGPCDAAPLVAELAKARLGLWEARELGKMKAAGKPPTDGKWKLRYKQAFRPSELVDSTIPDGWKPVTVSHIALLDQGFAFKSSEFSKSGIKLLRGENLEPGKLRWADTVWWPKEKLSGLEHLQIDAGEIILALDRPIISSGLKIARASEADLPCLLVQRMMRFKMVEPKLTSWLYFNLQESGFIRHLTDGLTGSDLPHVTGTGVAEFTFALPPLAEQTEIVRRVEALFALADRIEARLATVQRLVERLTPATLSKAFRGDLVPQDPNDEPATVLLQKRSDAHAARGSAEPSAARRSKSGASYRSKKTSL